MVKVAHYFCKHGIPIAGPMRALDPPRKFDLLIGEYMRVSSLELCSREVYDFKVPGAVAELGVFRGEFAAMINRAFPDRTLYLFDTFEDFPEEHIKRDADAGKATYSRERFKNTSVEHVMGRMRHPDKVVVKQGMFPDTAADMTEKAFAFVSIDADLYTPIYEGLKYFYPLLSPGGYIFVHDYNNSFYAGSKEAVRQFAEESKVGYFPLSDASGSAIIVKARG